MFWKRFFSGAVVLSLTVLFGYLGGPFLALALGVLSSAAYLEYTKASRVREEGHRVNGFEYVGVVTIILYYGMLLLFSIGYLHSLYLYFLVSEIQRQSGCGWYIRTYLYYFYDVLYLLHQRVTGRHLVYMGYLYHIMGFRHLCVLCRLCVGQA